MKLLKWIILICAGALAAAIFHANRMDNGLDIGFRRGDASKGSTLPRQQEKVTSPHFWEAGREWGLGGERENPYVD